MPCKKIFILDSDDVVTTHTRRVRRLRVYWVWMYQTYRMYSDTGMV